MDGNRARALLRVRPHASTDEIRTAFRGAVRAAHPDGGGDAAAFRSLVAARDELLRCAPVHRTTTRWDVAAPPTPSVDVSDVSRPQPRSSAVPTPDFDVVLAAILAA